MILSLRHYHSSSYSHPHSYTDSHTSAFAFISSNLSVLRSIRANVRKVAHGKVGIRVVVPKEGLHLRGLVDNCHYGEVIGVVPSPRDAEGSFLSSFSIQEFDLSSLKRKPNLLAWYVVKRVVGSRAAIVDHSTCRRVAAIANINTEVIRASVGVAAVCFE
jgi:hypothetical protein